MTINRRIVALLVRFDNGYEAIENRAAEAYNIDRQCDSGEFSGPAVLRQAERQADALARRLGFSNAAVAENISVRLGMRLW